MGKDLENETLGNLPLKEPVFVTPETPIEQTLEKMRSMKVGCAVVRDQGHILGIFTERDVLIRVIEDKVDLTRPIIEVMTPGPKTLGTDNTIADAVILMTEGGYRNIPITEAKDGKAAAVTKILSIRDLVRYFGSNFPEEVYNLPPDPDQMARAREGA